MVPVGRRHVLPFLTVAYPASVAVLWVRPYCRVACPAFGTVDVVALLAVLAGSGLVSIAPVERLRRSRLAGNALFEFVTTPARATAVVLLLLYLALVGFLALDAVDGARSTWKLVVLPVSLLPFAPAWVLYSGTFVLAALLPVLGVGSSPALTTVVRAAVVVAGFGASPAWQYALLEAVIGRGRRR